MSEDAPLESLPITLPKLALPATTVAAVQLAGRVRQQNRWAERVVGRHAPVAPLAFSKAVLARFDVHHAPGSRAAEFAQRLLPDPLDMGDVELTVSPYAPPMRQLSGVRQGVPMWSASDQRPSAAPSPRPAAVPARAATPTPARAFTPTPPRAAQQTPPDKNKIPDDLMAILNMHRALGRMKD